MNNKNESVVVANTTPSPAQQLQWLSEQIQRYMSVLPPSTSVVLQFVEQVLDVTGSQRLKRLAILAGLKTIVERAGGHSGPVLQSGQPAAREQVEWDSFHRGRTLYLLTANVVETSTIDGVLPPFGEESDLAHIILITTEPIDPEVREYASGVYRRTWGIEFAVLDCLGFVRHFLPLFQTHRAAFLESYHALVMSEPESAVSYELKHNFLSLLQAASATAVAT